MISAILTTLLWRSSSIFAVRSRGTPRVASNPRRRVRDFAQARSYGNVNKALADAALTMGDIDHGVLYKAHVARARRDTTCIRKNLDLPASNAPAICSAEKSMKTLLALAALALPSLALANGGGYIYGNSKLGSLGLFQPKNAEQIEMRTELLEIDLGVENASVSVEYTLHNPGKSVTIEAGFPITSNDVRDVHGKSIPPPTPLEKFNATADGETVISEVKWDLPREATSKTRYDFWGKTVAGWHVFKLPFKTGQTRTFRVTYETPYSGESWSISDKGGVSTGAFHYLFSTAAVWKGPIQSGKVVIRAAHVDADKVKFNLPKRFARKGDVWTWEFKDFEPTLADDLQIAVHPARESWGQALPGSETDDTPHGVQVEYVKSGGRWEMHHRLYTASATSTLAAEGERTYDAQNVAGWERPWAEGAADDGVGESLTLKLKQPRKVSHIGIRNGFVDRGKSALYSANNRVAEFAVSINGAKPFTARVPDEALNFRHFFIPVPAATKAVNDIKLTIQKVYRGEKHRDTCVTQIILVTPLEKAPKIEPVR